ncbi:DUF2281 domain-containing protein [Desulfobacterium sp. N47]|uniref:DUF2281 domain-containing protein n=1 Tax=uncultured Desulfobacterium sp. TaxID=201089 RepID=E1YI35_9BACT|nr:hypothetical protein N47_D31130 [uncultured Desulfobacterium sp.]
MKFQDIEAKIDKLPAHVIPEVNDFIDYLLVKYGEKKVKKSKFKFDWESGLSNLKNEYTSVELQHKALEWR